MYRDALRCSVSRYLQRTAQRSVRCRHPRPVLYVTQQSIILLYFLRPAWGTLLIAKAVSPPRRERGRGKRAHTHTHSAQRCALVPRYRTAQRIDTYLGCPIRCLTLRGVSCRDHCSRHPARLRWSLHQPIVHPLQCAWLRGAARLQFLLLRSHHSPRSPPPRSRPPR